MSRIGIVTGMPFERDLVLRVAQRCGWENESLLVEAAGIGGTGTERFVQAMAEAGVAGIVSLGLAGALDPNLAPADLVVPETVLDDAGNSHPVNPEWYASVTEQLGEVPVVGRGPLLSTQELVSCPTERENLHNRFGAAAVDMESAATGAAAANLGLPFVVVRAISDPSGQGLPTAVSAGVRDGRLHMGRFVLDVLKHPLQTGALLRLGIRTRAACGTLERVCRTVGPGFAFPG